MGGRRRAFAAAAAVAALAIAPPGALAADTFVDPAGDDLNDCLQALPGGPGQGPCETIGAAIAAAGPGDTIHVAPSTYAETLTLDDGKRLVPEFPDPSATVIENAVASPAVTVAPGSDGSRLAGFTVHSSFAPVWLYASATVEGNRFDQLSPPSAAEGAAIQVDSSAISPTIAGNTFADPDPTDQQTGVLTRSSASPAISGNGFTGFNVGVHALGGGGTPTIAGNSFTGVHSDGAGRGYGILVEGQQATVTGNTVRDPDPDPTDETGIGVAALGPPTGAALQHNQVYGHPFGVDVDDTDGPVTLDGDLLAANGIGLRAIDAPLTLGPTDADVTATNVTVVDSTSVTSNDIRSIRNLLTLDSSIVGDGIETSATTCAISFSRGPTTSGGDCELFQTAVTPGFAEPLAGNYHLRPGSPMIDAGNPEPPQPGSLDADGANRLVDGARPCGARRDIGADEFGKAIDCDPPATFIVHRPPTRTRDRTPRFRFRSDEARAGFECKVDGQPFTPCGAAKTLGRQRKGRHRLLVRAVDPAGNTDPTPARAVFRVVRR